jgi:hypothetical protein
MHATVQPWHAEGRPSPTGRTAETTGAATLVIPCRRSFDHAGFNFQILLLPRGLGEGLPWAKECWVRIKRTSFAEQPAPLCPASAGSNLRPLTAGEKARTFSQTFSHPSLKEYETHCSTGSLLN